VQMQASSHSPSTNPVPIELPTEDLAGRGDPTDSALAAPFHPLTGFLAVSAACFTSGLAGVYFEMVLKGKHCRFSGSENTDD
jgi:solute carrier family 35 (UDP-sugar transporter), member A1/2/3